MNGLLWARLLAAVAIVGAVLGVTIAAFARVGIASATAWFQLMQGVAGLALGWLFTSQGMDAALLRAAEEAREAERVRIEGMDLSEKLTDIRRTAQRSALLLKALHDDPATRQKVEEKARAIEREEGE